MNKKFNRELGIIFLGISLLITTISCSDEVISERTKKIERNKFKDNLIATTINDAFSKGFNEDSWQGAFWGMELAQYRSKLTDRSVVSALKNYNDHSDSFNRALLEVTYSLYINEFNEIINSVSFFEDNSKLFAMSIEYLRKSNYLKNEQLFKRLVSRFPSWKDDPILFMLGYNLQNSDKFLSQSEFKDLLNHSFWYDKTIVISFQRSDRSFQGITIIRNKNGEFVKDENDQLFHISHLARAVTDLPSYITNGNTPQGIFSIQRFGKATNVFIGPSTTIETVLPFEVNPNEYFHSEIRDTIWNKEIYAEMLPEKLRNFTPLFEAYYAGKAGRNEIILHGTTIDPSFYEGKSYYPNTPSLGCITAIEKWDEVSGKRLESDQQKLVNKLNEAGISNSFFMLIEIDDKKEAVSLEEVLNFIR